MNNNIGFDFDGVLHISISKKSKNGQIHPNFKLSAQEIKPNLTIIKLIPVF